MPPFLGFLGSGLLAAGAGISFVMQQVVTQICARLSDRQPGPGSSSYLGGTLCMAMLAIVLREALPSILAAGQSHWWAWSGGFFGAIYIAISILLVQRLGAAIFVALLVTGQMLSSVLFDHYGLFGVAQRPAGVSRLLGSVLLIVSVILIRR
jgi:transporter family-2 protein